jgi:hypothetical protein
MSWCGGRRKCFSAAPSTDVEFGVAVGGLYASRPDAPADAERAKAFFARAQASFRDYDMTFSRQGPRLRREFVSRSAELNREFERLMGVGGAFEGFNDNRLEQHGWVWAP